MVWYFEHQCHLIPSTAKLSQRDIKQWQRHEERDKTIWSGQKNNHEEAQNMTKRHKNTTKRHKTTTKRHKIITEWHNYYKEANILQRHKIKYDTNVPQVIIKHHIETHSYQRCTKWQQIKFFRQKADISTSKQSKKYIFGIGMNCSFQNVNLNKLIGIPASKHCDDWGAESFA